MAVKKIKWTQLVTNIHVYDMMTYFTGDLQEIDSILNSELHYNQNSLYSLGMAVQSLLTNIEQINKWNNLYIYLSSYRENDTRFVELLKNKIREYLGFYFKILTDEGVQRSLVYAKTYNASGTASSAERGFNSVTPQNSSLYDSTHPESDALFDQAIADFASSIDKNKATSSSSSQGGSRTNVTGVTWDEAKKNLQLFFYNELKDYIMSIPERIYSYYCLETLPAPELYKATVEYIETVIDIMKNE